MNMQITKCTNVQKKIFFPNNFCLTMIMFLDTTSYHCCWNLCGVQKYHLHGLIILTSWLVQRLYKVSDFYPATLVTVLVATGQIFVTKLVLRL